ncbi:MAG: UDP-N-acetylmuramoyl-tripeptide--D-alanyl-D-alanine ligase [Lutibacter sp.]|nr:UDP-N-acetylmuramoyl-tripeptide--D-alanyl-D-alanine ligase [Lutibacter sp.]
MDIKKIYALFSLNYLADTDTRKIRKGSIYFALKGENFDGNKFALEALANGADYAIVDNPQYANDSSIILVEDTLKTLQNLAKYHRAILNIPIISLTGSNGKTTTKELINTVLSKKFRTTATTGNLNNHIGVPLTLLSMTPNTEIGIIEMGANHLKEIEFLCSIAQPNFGYITNFGKAHLEGFGSFEGIIEGKSELYNYLRKTNGTAFINSEDPLQIQQSKKINAIRFNTKIIRFIEANPFVKVSFDSVTIKSNLIGAYNYNNIAAAITIGNYFKVSTNLIKEALENYIPTNNRSQIIETNNSKIILDAYNANPSSMQAALENFNNLNGENKIVFLGDMFELGESSASEHQKIADLAMSFNFSKLFLIGKAFSATNTKNALIFDSFESFKKTNLSKCINQSTILIKGSRGMALERILDLF